jgi:hypothetical protein
MRWRTPTWLAATLLALLGGGLVAVPVILVMRAWLGVEFETARAATIGIGYLTWVVAAVAISAGWLWRGSRR